ncbi:putative membrane protein [Amycolatopsis camponoti]|uniref:Putative membrane protein n=1 Tax=Amycolatopsis camponoti TaxID=2606593 RepID=A0A6I8M3A1_9PSEU|nr:putative membrane protein [Amycolatopsis camponoti]
MLVTDYVDGYCERVGPGLWGEPLNSLSNLAFLLAAVLVWRLAGGNRTGRLLAVLIGLVFAASTVFHLVATRWAAAGDSLFILVFVLVYAVLFARVFFGVRAKLAWLAAPAFLALTAVTALLGGGLYLSALVGLFAFAALLAFRRDAYWTHFAVAGAVFALSLSLRTLDRDVCDYVPAGTHFLWHLLNGVVLYLVSRTMVRKLSIVD